jgi:two-component system sensor kinase FixL
MMPPKLADSLSSDSASDALTTASRRIFRPALVALAAISGLALLAYDPADRGTFALAARFSGGALLALSGWLASRRAATSPHAPAELHAAIDTTSIALTLCDGVITHWSRGCETLYGWSAAEAIGRDKYQLLHSRLRKEAAVPPFDFAGNERELTEQRKDGTKVDVIERRSVLANQGDERRVALAMLDISDRVRAEDALRESEARLTAAMAAQGIAVAHWDIASGRLEWSQGSEQALGCPTGSIADHAAWEALFDPDDLQEMTAEFADAAARRAPRVDFRYRLCGADGRRRWIEGVASLFYDSDGTLRSVVRASVDVSDRVERDAALAAREAQLRSVLDAAPSAIVVVDSGGTIVEFNPAAERLWGYAADEVIGQSGLSLVAPQDHERFLAILAHRPTPQENAASRPAAAGYAVARDGRRIAIDVDHGHAQAPGGYLITLFCRDISEQIATERRLAELAADLAHVGRQSAMSELAADLAHELNQPLSATANFLATARILLGQNGDPTRIADLLRMGEEQTLRSGAIIRRLRDFLQKREFDLHAESIDSIVHEAVDLVLFGVTQHEIHLVYALDPSVDLILADRIQIQQVLVNLVRNAVDALRHQPLKTREIVITSRAAGNGMVEIAVSDTGPGLPETSGDIFQARFVTSKTGAAMGIGLSISRRIVEAHGGTLVAENRPRGGAAFRFTLPLFEEVVE